MSLDGMGVEQIADALSKEEILTPRFYWQAKGIQRAGKPPKYGPCHWNSSTVTKILTLQEYCGDVLNFKTYSKSYKNKRRIENDRENWAIFKDVHEAIIDRATWEKIQERRGKVRKRRTHEGEKHMFSGLLVCADCGNNLHFHFNQGNPEIEYFNCSNYKGNRGTCSSTHYIRADFLEQIVLAKIRRLTRFVCHYEKEFAALMMGFTQQAAEDERKLIQKELDAAKARDRELDSLFERIYEDNVAGKLSDERFSRMSTKYEDEQKELRTKVKTLQEGIERTKSKAVTADMFISSVRKYLTNCSAIDAELEGLFQEIEVVTELTQRCIHENARSAQSQEEYAERYNGYVTRYEGLIMADHKLVVDATGIPYSITERGAADDIVADRYPQPAGQAHTLELGIEGPLSHGGVSEGRAHLGGELLPNGEVHHPNRTAVRRVAEQQDFKIRRGRIPIHAAFVERSRGKRLDIDG